MQIEVGMILEGKVSGITNFGAFVNLPEGETGMIHISEVSVSYVKDIRDYLKEGQEVKVKVINIDERGKIGLSIKRLEDNAAEVQPKQRESSNQARGSFRSQSSQAASRNGSEQPMVYSSRARKGSDSTSFEDMMQRFKVESDDKLSDLKRTVDSKTRSPGFSRRNTNKY